jgi:branched-chain amino acid transport system permease protein
MTRVFSLWKPGVKTALLSGLITVLLSLMGMVEAFSQREIVSGVLSMDESLLGLAVVFMGYVAARRTSRANPLWALINSVTCGFITGGILLLLILVGGVVNLRSVFINASPALYELISFGGGLETAPLLFVAGSLCGLFAGLLYLAPVSVRRTLTVSLVSIIGAGVLQDMLRPTLAAWGPLSGLADWFFASNGLTGHGATVLFLVIAAVTLFWSLKGQAVQSGFRELPAGGQKAIRWSGIVVLVIILLVLPQVLGLFLSEVMTIVGLYVLLGLGLNIVVGYAGLLDLGYVAFFAIGAYTTAILTSPELGFFSLTFWQALPFAVLLGIISGVLLGVPVLKMRGDYLAIATLGFGEIIRILVLSDFLRPWLGGAQGIGKIPKATLGSLYEFGMPQEIYYLILAGCILVIFISLRLRDSRMGRAWKAMREDEDVAQAMGINLVATKLLAFGTGAGFSALSGAIFATKLTSVYPHSFNVMISINIICVIIVGGMGSIPGVIVGAIALVGLPELLREFAEYRLLVYGAALVAMMLLRPEGLWPEAVRRREFHEEEIDEAESESSTARAPAQ